MPQPDFYAELGVPRDATREQLKDAYRGLVKGLHPDVGGEDIARYQRVVRAWDVLSDPESRAKYDRGEWNEKVENGPPERETVVATFMLGWMAALNQFLETGQPPPGGDLLKAVDSSVRAHCGKLDEAIAKARQQVERAQVVLAATAIETGLEEESLLAGSIQTRIGQLQEEIRGHEQSRAISDKVLALIGELRFDATKMPQSLRAFNTITFAWGGSQ